MFRRIIVGGSSVLGAAFLPIDWANHDKLSDEIKTVKDFRDKKHQDNETGMDRLKMMLTLE